MIHVTEMEGSGGRVDVRGWWSVRERVGEREQAHLRTRSSNNNNTHSMDN